jgi:flagellar biosynthesis/type III secretory pathway chaperone
MIKLTVTERISKSAVYCDHSKMQIQNILQKLLGTNEENGILHAQFAFRNISCTNMHKQYDDIRCHKATGNSSLLRLLYGRVFKAFLFMESYWHV